jgi:hypothetical protein
VHIILSHLHITVIFRWFKMKANMIEIAVLGEYKRKESSGSTLNRYLAFIRSILRKASLEWEWIDKAPKIRLYNESKRRVRWIPTE